MSQPEDELQTYRRVMGEITPENPQREADISAALRAFDALHQPAPDQSSSAASRWLARIFQPRNLGFGGAALAALFAVAVFLPHAPTHVPNPAARPSTAPPDLRLALPSEPSAPAAATTTPSRDETVMAALTGEIPQYFALPWSRGQVLALLPAADAAGAEVLFENQDRVLALIARPSGLAGPRGGDETYHRFVVSLGGLALLQAGQATNADWDRARLLSEARQAAQGQDLREAALAAVLGE